MAKKPVKLVFRSRPWILVLVLVAVICSTVAVATMHSALQQSRAQYETLRQQAAELEAENEELVSDIEDLGSVESAIEIAEDELGLVSPGTVIFDPAID